MAFAANHYKLQFPGSPLPSLCETSTRLSQHILLKRARSSAPWRCDLTPRSTTDNVPSTALNPPPKYKVHLLNSIQDISQSEWDSFAQSGCASPFLRHDWIRCLEQSACASATTGWAPRHIILRGEATQEIVAIAPAYVKTHSLGEFVFDQEWADAAYGAGILYYPKLLVAVPFTPATGRRILTKDDTERPHLLRVVGLALTQICEALEVSSVHVNFCAQDEVEALAAAGFLQRKSVQYHFTNYKKDQKAITVFEQRLKANDGDPSKIYFDGTDAADRVPYSSFEDYLSEFKSKKRIKMRRERTYVREENRLAIEYVEGEDIDHELMEKMFYIYKTTIDKLFFGRQYLTVEFFKMLADCEDFKKHICLVLAKSKEDGRIVGGTFNVIGKEEGGAFYGRYWGCIEEFRYLHFEVCYYAAIEYCIKHGLSRMEPGAGGGDFKYMRGFEPSITMSMHYLRDERLSNAVSRYLDMESMHIEGAVSQMKQNSAIRSKVDDQSL